MLNQELFVCFCLSPMRHKILEHRQSTNHIKYNGEKKHFTDLICVLRKHFTNQSSHTHTNRQKSFPKPYCGFRLLNKHIGLACKFSTSETPPMEPFIQPTNHPNATKCNQCCESHVPAALCSVKGLERVQKASGREGRIEDRKRANKAEWWKEKERAEDTESDRRGREAEYRIKGG